MTYEMPEPRRLCDRHPTFDVRRLAALSGDDLDTRVVQISMEPLVTHQRGIENSHSGRSHFSNRAK